MVRRYSSNSLVIALLTLLAASLGAVGCESSGGGGGGGEGTAMMCKDGVDNDGDGYTDCRDQDCYEFVFCVEGEGPDAVGGDVYIRPDGDVQGGDPTDTYVHPDEDVQGGDPVDVLTPPEDTWVEPGEDTVEPGEDTRVEPGEDIVEPPEDTWVEPGEDIVEPPEDTWVEPDVTEEGPAIDVSPSAIDFGLVPAGTSATRTLLVRNTGSAELGIDRVVLDADAAFSLELDGVVYEVSEGTRGGVDLEPGLWLGPGLAAELTVTFAPTTGSISEGSIALRSNDPLQEWAEISLRGVGVLAGQAAIDIEPTELDFGRCVVGAERQLQLRIFSRGDASLVIDQLALDEAHTAAAFLLETGEAAVGGLPIVVPPNDSVELTVVYAPTAVSEVDPHTGQPVLDTGVLLIGSNVGTAPVEVMLSGWGVLGSDAAYAVILSEEGDEVIPQTTLHLLGDQSYASAGEIRKWEWRVDQPVGSQSIFVPSPTFPNPTFEVNVAGTYTFYLDVWDQDNVKSSEPAFYEVAVIPDEAIHIELLWTTPGDPDQTDTGPFAGSDVDLHFIHPNAPSDPNAPDLDGDGAPDPYFDQPYDVYWFNPHPDWGAFGAEFDDDPGLDRDDTDGAGPENVNLNVPEDGKQYQVAVHYWNDHGYGASFVTVRVYIYQAQVFELTNVRLVNYDLWCVAFVDWPSGTVNLCEAEGGGYRITSNYQHPMFFDK